jgi:hypothetical protein
LRLLTGHELRNVFKPIEESPEVLEDAGVEEASEAAELVTLQGENQQSCRLGDQLVRILQVATKRDGRG